MEEVLCIVSGCGKRARRNKDSKGMCLDHALEDEKKRGPWSDKNEVQTCPDCGVKSDEPGAPRFIKGRCKPHYNANWKNKKAGVRKVKRTREEYLAYMAEYRRKNRDKLKVYRERNRERHRAYMREYRRKNREKAL